MSTYRALNEYPKDIQEAAQAAAKAAHISGRAWNPTARQIAHYMTTKK